MQDSAALTALAERVAALERQSRRLKRQLFAALVALLCLGTVSATLAQEHDLTFTGDKGTLRIDATGIHFLNVKGTETALIGYNDITTLPAAVFRDESNQARLLIGLSTQSDGLLRMWSADGKERVGLGGNATLYFRDTAGNRRLYVGTTTEGEGNIQMYNSSEKIQTELASTYLRVGDANGQRGYLGVTTDGQSSLQIFDSSHTMRNFVGLTSGGDGDFQILNSSGKVQTEVAPTFFRISDSAGTERSYIGVATDNTPVLKLWDSNHTERAIIGLTTTNQTAIDLFDAQHVMRNYIGIFNNTGTPGFAAYDTSGTAFWSSR